MPKRSYVKRITFYDSIIGGKYTDHSRNVEMLISTIEDGNMDPCFSGDAALNYQTFMEKYGINPEETFSPAIGRNYGVITIDGGNEKKYAGKFIEQNGSQDEYYCDAVVVCDSGIAVAFRPADCPVILIVGNAPQDKTVISLVHAGRAELMAETPKIAAEKMKFSHRVHIPSATAYIFPHICENCYALKYMDLNTRRKAGDSLKIIDGYYHLDLLGWLTRQLAEAGIHRIATSFYRCTSGVSPDCVSRLLHDTKKFKGLFSHYRSFHTGSTKGRFLVLARIIDQDYEDDE